MSIKFNVGESVAIMGSPYEYSIIYTVYDEHDEAFSVIFNDSLNELVKQLISQKYMTEF